MSASDLGPRPTRSSTAGDQVIPVPGLSPLFRLFLAVSESLLVGDVSGGVRRLTPVDGGSFQGEKLSGRVVSGNDAVMVRADGCAQLDVRCVLETDAGELIYMTYRGVRNPVESEAEDEYFRCTFQFETSSQTLGWLNDVVAVGAGLREPAGPWYDVYEVT